MSCRDQSAKHRVSCLALPSTNYNSGTSANGYHCIDEIQIDMKCCPHRLDTVMAQSQAAARRQQGYISLSLPMYDLSLTLWICAELQLQYQNYKNNLQQIAQKIGDIEQETEEHK